MRNKRGIQDHLRKSKQARDWMVDNGRGERGGDKKTGKSALLGIKQSFFRMSSHKMSANKIKLLGEDQKKRKKNERTSSMTSKFLRSLILELSSRLPKLSTSRLGLKFARMLGRTSKSNTPSSLESCTLLLRELRVSDEPNRVKDLSHRTMAELA